MYAVSFYIGLENIGWSVVEKKKDICVYKYGSSNKDKVIDLLNYKELTFKMSDYLLIDHEVLYNKDKLSILHIIIKWFYKKAPLATVVLVNYSRKGMVIFNEDEIENSINQAISWFKINSFK